MTASEKLKALNERRSTDDMVTYHDALPEIIAVIEAAENFDARFEERFIKGMAKPLNDALAALEEKLS